jgi:branched-chain amino acid transport system ATP-binding protein
VSPVTDLLVADGVSVSFGGVKALVDVELGVGAAELVGLIGPNGAGKTTLIDAVTGFTPVTAGRVSLEGRDLAGLAPDRRARLGLVRTFQAAETFAPLTVEDHLLAAAQPPGAWRALGDLLLPRRGSTVDVRWVLDELGLAPVAHEYPDDLSYGQRKLVDLARALVTRPKVVLCDEPAAGLDSTETAELAGLLRTVRDRGIGVLLIDHDMDLVLEVCDRVYVLDFGRLIASGTPAEIRADAKVIDAYLGAAS